MSKSKSKKEILYPCTACGKEYKSLNQFFKHVNKHKDVDNKIQKGTKLTMKEQKFVEEFVRTGNGVRSALAVYDTKSYKVASNIASTNLDKPRIQEAVKSIAESIPDSLLLKVHLEGLEASKKVVKTDPETGESEEIGVMPDYATRHKYLDTGYKLKGLLIDKSEMKIGAIGIVKHIYQKVDELDNGGKLNAAPEGDTQ